MTTNENRVEYNLGDCVRVVKYLLLTDMPESLKQHNAIIIDKKQNVERSMVPDYWDYKVKDCNGNIWGWINGLYILSIEPDYNI